MIDPLGDRFKAIEHEWKAVLPRNCFHVIRVDGRAFHTFTRGLVKPFDHALMYAMDRTAEVLCKQVSGALCAYVQSDEISVITTDLSNPGTEPWFGGVVQKVASVASSMASVNFNEIWYSRNPPKGINFWPTDLATFDARVFPLPDVPSVADYLWWRQSDSRRNAVSMLTHHYIGKNKVNNMGTKERVEMLADVNVIMDEQNGRFVNGGVSHPVKRPDEKVIYRKGSDVGELVQFERTVWMTEPVDRLRNWFYDNHIDRFPVTTS